VIQRLLFGADEVPADSVQRGGAGTFHVGMASRLIWLKIPQTLNFLTIRVLRLFISRQHTAKPMS